jgi:RNA polymerase sigma factor (sigma-70 family)
MSYVTPIVLGMCYDSNLTYEEGCDIFGQVSYKLLKNLDKLRSDKKFFPYLRSITRAEIAMIFRKRGIEKKSNYKILKALYHKELRQPDEKYEEARNTEILIQAIMKLPEKQARLIMALFFEPDEPSYEELSRRFNIPISSIGPIRARGLENLHRILKQTRYKIILNGG